MEYKFLKNPLPYGPIDRTVLRFSFSILFGSKAIHLKHHRWAHAPLHDRVSEDRASHIENFGTRQG